jgi:hypothetical protein
MPIIPGNGSGGGGGGGGGASADGWFTRTDITNLAGTNYPFVRGITSDNSGNIYVVGEDAGTNKKGLIVKYDTTGTTEWARSAGTNGTYTRYKSATTDSSGNIYCVGTDYGHRQGQTPAPELGLIGKWNSSGVSQFQKIVKNTQLSTNNDYVRLWQAQTDSSGNIWAQGESQIGNNGNGTLDNWILFKFNSSGTILGQWKIGDDTASQSRAYDMVIDSSDNVYITGAIYDPSSTSYPHGLIVKVNSSGVFQWSKIFGTNQGSVHYEVNYSVDVDSSGNVYTVGYTQTQSSPSAIYQTYIIKYNSSGTVQWSKMLQIGGASDGSLGTPVDFAITPNNEIYLVANAPDLNNEYLLFKYNTAGTQQDAWKLGFNDSYNMGMSEATTVEVDSNGNLILGTYYALGANYQFCPIKLPAIIEAGSFDDLDITDVSNGGDITFSPTYFTYKTITASTVTGWSTVDANTGSYPVTPANLTFTEQLDSVTGGSGGGSGYSAGVANLNTYPTSTQQISYFGMHLAWNGDGTAFTWWYQYQNMEWWDVSTPWDLSTATKNATKSQTPNNILGGNSFLTFDYNADGTKLLAWSFDNPEPKAGIKEWNLSTAYDPNSHGGSPSTNSSITSATFAAGNPKAYYNYQQIQWIDSGNKVALTEEGTEGVNFYNATTAYDLTTINFTSPSSTHTSVGYPNYISAGKWWFSDNGLSAYTASSHANNSVRVTQCSMSTAWDLSTLTVVAEKELGQYNSGPNVVQGVDDIHVVPSENKLYMTCFGGVDQSGNNWNDGTGNYQSGLLCWIGEWEFT